MVAAGPITTIFNNHLKNPYSGKIDLYLNGGVALADKRTFV